MEKSDIINVSKNRGEKGNYVKPILKGLQFTMSNFFKKPVTIQYPDQKTVRSQRWRGLHKLNVDEQGELKCVACGLCAAVCPSQAITILAREDEGGTRHPEKFEVNELRCIFCGFCQDACPKSAISLTKIYEYVNYNREDFVFDISILKTTGEKWNS